MDIFTTEPVEDTQPVVAAGRRPRQKRRRWVLGVASLVVIAACVALSAPMLLSPPPELEPGYALPTLGESSIALEANTDQLIFSADTDMAAFIPAGAYPGEGTLVLQTRDPELVPLRVDGGWERIRVVDLLVIGPSQETVAPTRLLQPALVCFKLSEDWDELRAVDPDLVAVERFEDREGSLGWVRLREAPGWEADQICGLTEHLSIFALAVNIGAHSIPPSVLPTPSASPTQASPDIYLPPLR